MKLLLRSILFFTVASFAPLAFGQSTWTGGAGDGQWATGGNWNPAGEPLGDAQINLDATIALPGVTTTTGELTLTNGTINLNATTSTFTANLITVDTGGTLNLNIPTGGQVTALNSAHSSFTGDGNGTGTFNLTGGGVLNLVSSTFASAVGIGGTGTFNQASATVNVTGALFIGSDGNVSTPPSTPTGTTIATGGTGTYNLSGSGTLSAGELLIGVGSGTGGGTTTGGSTPTVGTLNMSGGTLTAGTVLIGLNNTDPTAVAGSGTGTVSGSVVQTAGGATINDLEVGVSPGSTASYTLSGTGTIGATTVGTDIILGTNAGAAGTFQQSSGTTVATDTLTVGDSGAGTYLLQGGQLTVDTELSIGDLATGSGSLTQSSGSTLIVNGTFNIGAGGGATPSSFNYDGGTLTLSSGIAIGASGIFNQNASITLTNPATQAITIATGGAYNLNAGTLSTGGSTVFTGTGNFNFAGGTVAVTGSAWTDPLNGTISGTSTINTTTAGATLSGNLTGSGTLNILGGHTVTLTGTNNVADSWGANITGGSTLLATNINSLSSTGSYNIGTGSTFTIANSINPTDTFNGTISDSGDTGGAIFNFEGAHKLVLAGVTNLSINSATNITGGGSLEVDQGTISNVNGSAGNPTDTFDVGSGTTTGTVTLLGSNNFGTGLVTVNTGSTLLAGNITGNVTSNGILGTLGTFATPAPLTMSGNLISGNLNPAAVLLINANGTTADAFTLTGGGSTANLSGIVQVTGAATQTYTIVTAPGGITIGAAGLTSPTPGVLFSAVLSSTPTPTTPIGPGPIGDHLYLITTQLNFQQAASLGLLSALTPNETAVAGALNPIITNSVPYPAAFTPILTAFNQLLGAQIPGALEELTPESLQYARNIAFENSTFLAERMDGVDADLRGGYGGLDTSAVSVVTPGFESGLGRSLGSLLAYDDPVFHSSAPNGVNYYPGGGGGTSSPSSSPSSASPSTSTPTWDSSSQVISDSPNPYLAKANPSGPEMPGFSEFIGGDVILANLNQNQSGANAPSSKASYTAADATAGVSFRMTSHLAAGILFDYNHTDAKTDSNGSKTDVDSYSPGLFATYFDHGFYANGLFSFGYNNYSNTRDISVLGETASSHPSGQQYVGDLDCGYDFHPAQNWVVGPTLGLTYTHLDIDSFTETGAPGADLAVQDQSADSLRSRLGGHVVFQTNTGDVLLQPNLTAMWQHEYLDSSSGITSSFNDFSSNPFTIQTAAPSRDSALIGCGLTATLNNSMALYLNYLADVGAGDYWAQSVVGGFKARF
jgi:uncharacterized protein YhjY with autotransporter beta-barrel domain